MDIALKQRLVGATVLIALGAVVMFAIAAVMEGLFRQMVQDIVVRYSVAAITAAGWLAYIGSVKPAAPPASDGDP